ncbi:uncharacterized protein LOC133645687 isoform X3 [Entelurus aequoreus]|uniref:uncharacterized protein LOC133645687 isoform X3 n=1 Tax=Entelurus aequoreus TaxID=161455 RepID=UPI002B1DF314|nr:uncharacterized protein LOC133645687 isoform X3 [Entelurus aequoreus]
MSQKRTYPSGAEKRKKKKVEEEKKCHDKGPSPSSTVLSHTPPSSVPTVPSMSETTADLSTTSTTMSPSHHGPSSALPVDPAEWPSFLSDSDRTEQHLETPLRAKQDTPPRSLRRPRPRADTAGDNPLSTHLGLMRGSRIKRLAADF